MFTANYFAILRVVVGSKAQSVLSAPCSQVGHCIIHSSKGVPADSGQHFGVKIDLCQTCVPYLRTIKREGHFWYEVVMR